MNKKCYSNFEKNNIYLGDAYKLIKLLPNHSVDLIITDPPYDMGTLGNNTGCFKGREKGYKLELQQSSLNNGIDLSILGEFVRILKKINIYIWCNKEQIYDYLTYFVKEKNCNWEIIVWAKLNPPRSLADIISKTKNIAYTFGKKALN